MHFFACLGKWIWHGCIMSVSRVPPQRQLHTCSPFASWMEEQLFVAIPLSTESEHSTQGCMAINIILAVWGVWTATARDRGSLFGWYSFYGCREQSMTTSENQTKQRHLICHVPSLFVSKYASIISASFTKFFFVQNGTDVCVPTIFCPLLAHEYASSFSCPWWAWLHTFVFLLPLLPSQLESITDELRVLPWHWSSGVFIFSCFTLLMTFKKRLERREQKQP